MNRCLSFLNTRHEKFKLYSEPVWSLVYFEVLRTLFAHPLNLWLGFEILNYKLTMKWCLSFLNTRHEKFKLYSEPVWSLHSTSKRTFEVLRTLFAHPLNLWLGFEILNYKLTMKWCLSFLNTRHEKFKLYSEPVWSLNSKRTFEVLRTITRH